MSKFKRLDVFNHTDCLLALVEDPIVRECSSASGERTPNPHFDNAMRDAQITDALLQLGLKALLNGCLSEMPPLMIDGEDIADHPELQNLTPDDETALRRWFRYAAFVARYAAEMDDPAPFDLDEFESLLAQHQWRYT